ncbi:protein tweety homolog 2-like [Oxyura jamaicensis]|uniref:protein tweety homolog 2-like n=1 Tax=Oxyura jamaicensis TaxID=8884 RepID=UPI0015A6602E|nr:protein tweety homolog 2-like [Oxyura jamaicensis]
MPPARADYLAPWWAAWLHGVPHRDLRLQPVPAAFRPRDPEYQQSLLFLGLVATVCLGLNLLFLTAYLICLCCCKRDEEPDAKRPHSCCVTWMAVTAGLICCTAVGIGFYGNSETNDGVYQLLYALDNANHTLTGIDSLVGLRGRDPRPPPCPPRRCSAFLRLLPAVSWGRRRWETRRGTGPVLRAGGCRGPSPALLQGWAEPPWPSAGG